MPLIKPRTRGKQLVRHIARLDRETNETLFAYAQFIGEPTDYVLNQVIDTVLGKDKDFQAWRARTWGVLRATSRTHVAPAAADHRATPDAAGDAADLAHGRVSRAGEKGRCHVPKSPRATGRDCDAARDGCGRPRRPHLSD